MIFHHKRNSFQTQGMKEKTKQFPFLKHFCWFIHNDRGKLYFFLPYFLSSCNLIPPESERKKKYFFKLRNVLRRAFCLYYNGTYFNVKKAHGGKYDGKENKWMGRMTFCLKTKQNKKKVKFNFSSLHQKNWREKNFSFVLFLYFPKWKTCSIDRRFLFPINFNVNLKNGNFFYHLFAFHFNLLFHICQKRSNK